jgi:hypothetical protein
MKPSGFHLLVFFVAGPLAAQEPVETPRSAKTSTRLTQEIRVTLPKFTPPPPPVLDQPKSDGTEDDPNVLALPKFTVKEKTPAHPRSGCVAYQPGDPAQSHGRLPGIHDGLRVGP